MGYFCVDNLPIKLIPLFIELIGRSAEVRDRIALVIDIREGGFLQDFPDILDELKGAVQEIQVLFFEARDPVLVRRFSETRRPHPLAIAGSVEEGIAKEREALRPLRDRADRIIDTSRFNVHELKTYLYDHFSESGGVRTLFVSIVSFGYKHGLPADADLVFDVRFFPNPFFVDRLRAKTGLDREVTDYLEGISEYVAFCARIEDLLAFLLPYYVREGKAYLTIAFGCTGGRHRSVAIAERIGRALLGPAYRTRISHRDVVKE
jgi:UPF0042 nucleotide-binding protein